MNNNEYDVRIKHKKDTVSNWETNNPTILDGELILVTFPDKGIVKFKIGQNDEEGNPKSYNDLDFIDKSDIGEINIDDEDEVLKNYIEPGVYNYTLIQPLSEEIPYRKMPSQLIVYRKKDEYTINITQVKINYGFTDADDAGFGVDIPITEYKTRTLVVYANPETGEFDFNDESMFWYDNWDTCGVISNENYTFFDKNTVATIGDFDAYEYNSGKGDNICETLSKVSNVTVNTNNEILNIEKFLGDYYTNGIYPYENLTKCIQSRYMRKVDSNNDLFNIYMESMESYFFINEKVTTGTYKLGVGVVKEHFFDDDMDATEHIEFYIYSLIDKCVYYNMYTGYNIWNDTWEVVGQMPLVSTTLSSDSTNEEVPSAKSVYDYISEKIPTKISQLSDNSYEVNGINLAKRALTAERDINNNLIHTTYATKTEVGDIQSTVSNIEGQIPTKISDLTDDSLAITGVALAKMSIMDSTGNNIAESLANKADKTEIPTISTTLSASSTNDETASAKAVYDYIKNNSVTINDGNGVELKTHSIIATEGQTSFVIPFINSENILVLHNGIIISEAVNYNIIDNEIVLVDYASNEGDIITFIKISNAITKISSLEDDSEDNPIDHSIKADCDGSGNNISATYMSRDNLDEIIGSYETVPSLYDVSKYSYKITGNSTVCDKVIPTGSTVKSVKLYSDGGSSVNDGSDDGSIYLIRVRDNVCVYKKVFFVLDGWNNITVDYTVEEDCYFGIYNTKAKYTNSGVTDDYLYSVGIKNCYPLSPKVDDTVTITQAYSGGFALSLQIILADGIVGQITDKVDIYQGENNSGKVLTIGKDGNLTPGDKSPIYPHGGIISFIDDDTGKYVPDIWGEIIAQTNIRMGFACVTGYISGKETTVGVYEPMPLAYLQELYENGHEIYSHSYSHPDFASNSISLDTIDAECRKSRDWLLANGFIKNSDIIVYPGGMGSLATDKQSVVRQHYRYGIDTIEGGNLPEPIENPWCIYRYNADTRSLSELKALVDSAISEKKHLVFMNHAYQLNNDKDNQIQKMVDLINYIKEQNGTILPFAEAVHKIHGW